MQRPAPFRFSPRTPWSDTRGLLMALSASVALLGALAAPAPVLAGPSSASSASSDSVSTSVGSSSTSLQKSSDSSSGDKEKTAGDYRVIEMADAADRPGMVRLRLRPAAAGSEVRAAGGEFFLLVPRGNAELALIAPGQMVTARERPYGLEFARGEAREGRAGFFLVMADDWFRELSTRAVTL